MMPTDFSSLIGNELIKRYLKRMLAQKTVGNSLLFAGPDGIGKGLFAYALAAHLISEGEPSSSHHHKLEKGCHPDIHIYRPEGKLGLHSIQALRQFSDEVYLPPYEASKKVFIIHEANRMLSYSANALLKTFEEPPVDTVIILLSSMPEALLPTVLSRCRTVYFQALSTSEIETFLKYRYSLSEEEAARLARLAKGSLNRAVQLAEKGGDPNREFLLNVLSLGSLATYKELTQTVQTLTERVDAAKKQAEEWAKGDLYKGPVENLSAFQQQAIEKEIEGAAAISLVNEASSLLEIILSWYRDLHLLHVGGDLEYLANRDFQDELIYALQRGNIPSLEYVGKAVEETHEALQRSTSLQICLENLFLKLNFI
jgi:DNA polymerase III subunit delta'